THNGITDSSGTEVQTGARPIYLTGTITNTATSEIDATTGTIDLENVIINGGILGGTGTIATAGPNTDSTLNGVTLGTGTKVTARSEERRVGRESSSPATGSEAA